MRTVSGAKVTISGHDPVSTTGKKKDPDTVNCCGLAERLDDGMMKGIEPISEIKMGLGQPQRSLCVSCWMRPLVISSPGPAFVSRNIPDGFVKGLFFFCPSRLRP